MENKQSKKLAVESFDGFFFIFFSFFSFDFGKWKHKNIFTYFIHPFALRASNTIDMF